MKLQTALDMLGMMHSSASVEVAFLLDQQRTYGALPAFAQVQLEGYTILIKQLDIAEDHLRESVKKMEGVQ